MTQPPNTSALDGAVLPSICSRLNAVPEKTFLRLPTGCAFISAELPIGELCHEAAAYIVQLENRIKTHDTEITELRERLRVCEEALRFVMIRIIAANGNDMIFDSVKACKEIIEQALNQQPDKGKGL